MKIEAIIILAITAALMLACITFVIVVSLQLRKARKEAEEKYKDYDFSKPVKVEREE